MRIRIEKPYNGDRVLCCACGNKLIYNKSDLKQFEDESGYVIGPRDDELHSGTYHVFGVMCPTCGREIKAKTFAKNVEEAWEERRFHASMFDKEYHEYEIKAV